MLRSTTTRFALFSAIILFSQTAIAQPRSAYLKVWGFLKYNHPALASGRLDADSVFLAHLETNNVSALLRDLDRGQRFQLAPAKTPARELSQNLDQRWFK